MEIQGTEKSPQVVLVPCPLQGHLSPMLELGKVLHSKGFSIIVMHTMFNAPNPTKFPYFKFILILDDLSDTDPSPGNLTAFVKAMNAQCEYPLKKCLAQVEQQQGRVICVIYDMLMYISEKVSSNMKLRSMVLRPASASTTVAYNSIPRLYAEGYIPLKDSMLEEPLPSLCDLRYKDLSLSEIGDIDVIIDILKITNHVGSSSAIIWNTVDFLEGSLISQLQDDLKVPIYSIGPLHKMAPTSSTSVMDEDTSCIPWLDKQAPRSVIYISLGSVASLDEQELAEMAWGLADSGQQFLWVIRPGLVRNSEWIELLPTGFEEKVRERGHIVKWSPQKEVLAHGAIGGFWTHCGWNSTLEGISEGVPMICMPCFADQKVNARYLSHVWKIGLHLENELKRDKIEKAIRTVMEDKGGEEMRQRAINMKEKVNLSLRDGGSSSVSMHALVELLLSFQLV